MCVVEKVLVKDLVSVFGSATLGATLFGAMLFSSLAHHFAPKTPILDLLVSYDGSRPDGKTPSIVQSVIVMSQPPKKIKNTKVRVKLVDSFEGTKNLASLSLSSYRHDAAFVYPLSNKKFITINHAFSK